MEFQLGSFSISPSSEHSRLIFFRMDWLDLLAVQGTLKSLLQHSSKASILWCSAFLIVQLSHPYMTTGKTIALTRRIFVDKVMALLFNILSAAAAAAKSLHSCLTLCDPIDVKVRSLSHVRLFAAPWTVASQVPLFLGLFTRLLCLRDF